MLRRPDRFVIASVVLVLAGLAVKAWAVAGSWFYFDDLAFTSQAMTGGIGPEYLFQSYGGHLMPGGFALTAALSAVAPYTWWPWATVLLMLQALAAFGMLRLLLSLFGRQPLVLALLAGYLTYVFTVPASVWWAAGINQLPMLVSLAFGMHALVAHLRSGRLRSLLAAVAWTVAGLAFYEKTLLLLGVYAIVTLAYFSSGDTPTRLRGVWRERRLLVVAFTLLGAAYLATYLWLGLETGGTDQASTGWASLAWNVVMVSFATAIIGGPLSWDAVGAGSLAAPETLLQLAGWAGLAGAIYYAYRTRTASVRAWLPLAFTLTCNVVLLVGARAVVVGPAIGLEYRYQPESGALFVLGVGLALLPLRGASELNAERVGIPLPDRQPVVLVGVAASVCMLATVSTVLYVRHWQSANLTPTYFARVKAQLTTGTPVALVDAPIPQTLLWAYRFPENTYSHVFRPWAHGMTFPGAAVDDLYVFDDQGRLARVQVSPARSMLPPKKSSSGDRCGYQIDAGTTAIPLDGPVYGDGWWVDAAYDAPRSTVVTVSAGDSQHRVHLPAGEHRLLFSVEGRLNSVQMRDDGVGSGTTAASAPCVTSLELGFPGPNLP